MFAWRRRLSGAARTFTSVKVVSDKRGAEEESDSAIELCLPGGRRLFVRRGFDRQLLLELVQVMESPT